MLLVIPGAPDEQGGHAVLAGRARVCAAADLPEEDLIDPHDATCAFWFEEMEEPRATVMGAIHLAVWVPREEAQARIDAALEAGGHMVRDDFAPSWWTLADKFGNEVDVATVTGRS